MEFLLSSSEFRDDLATKKDWHVIIWSNEAIRTNNKPVFYRKYYSSVIQTVDDLRFDLSNAESYELIAKSIEKTNFLEWAGLRHYTVKVKSRRQQLSRIRGQEAKIRIFLFTPKRPF